MSFIRHSLCTFVSQPQIAIAICLTVGILTANAAVGAEPQMQAIKDPNSGQIEGITGDALRSGITGDTLRS